ncbi:MAG TPA: hypothetical protein PLL50_08185 [Propionicimonas sp.]|nr:hypothetical protein [Propionicimonas sp.]HQD97395.1 hypothetical protein [Propionicimonas sp.]
MSHAVPKSPGSCGSQWSQRSDGPTLECRMAEHHDGAHQAYYGDRLHEWSDADR